MKMSEFKLLKNEIVLDEIVVSSNCNSRFINFWPLVCKSWNDIFGISPTLVLVVNSKKDSEIIHAAKKFGKVYLVDEISSMPVENQAKLARWFYACNAGESIVSIEDIDTIFLQSQYLLDRLEHFESHLLLGVGSDIESYADGNVLRKFPASTFTGKGILFAELFGYSPGESFPIFCERFRKLKVFDDLEDPFNYAFNFSDESLIRAMRLKNDFRSIKVIPRSLDIKVKWIDRSRWPKKPLLDTSNYICVNFPRPLYENFSRCEFVIKHYFPISYPWIIPRNVSRMDALKWSMKDSINAIRWVSRLLLRALKKSLKVS